MKPAAGALTVAAALALSACDSGEPGNALAERETVPGQFAAPHIWPPSDLTAVGSQELWITLPGGYSERWPVRPLGKAYLTPFDSRRFRDHLRGVKLPGHPGLATQDSCWYAAIDLSRASTPEEFEAFWEQTIIDRTEPQWDDSGFTMSCGYDDISLGSPIGSVFTVIENPYAGEQDFVVEVSGTLTAKGAIQSGEALATLTAIELRGAQEIPRYEGLPARMGTEWGIGQVSAQRVPDEAEVPLPTSMHFREVIRLSAQSRGLIVAFGAKHQGQPGVSFELSYLRISHAASGALARSLKADGAPIPGDTPPWEWKGWASENPTRFQLDWTSRFGWQVPPYGQLQTTVRWPANVRRARLFTGLYPHPAADPDAEVEIVALVQRPGTDETTESRHRLTSADLDRWSSFELEVSDVVDFDEPVRVTVDCEPIEGKEGWIAPIVAGLRGIRETTTNAEREDKNLLLVSLDTLRADHVGGYGYERDTTPRLDDFAREALRFTNVWSTSAYTLPAHLSMLSGQLPSLHGVERPEQRRSPLTTPLLAEQLAAEGYATAAFTGGAMMLPDFGFASGFERYGILDPSITLEAEEVIERLLPVPGFDRETVARHGLQPALDWVDEHANEPWFLFIHTYAAHEFEPPPRFLRDLGLDGSIARDEEAMAFLGNQRMPDERARRYLIDRYDGGVRAADELVGRLLDHLDERDLRDDTVILITSDHGKEIGDRNQVRHGHSLQEEMVHVPLWLSAPGLKPGVIDSPKSLIDVAPTLIELLGLPPWPSSGGPEALQPRSLLESGNPRRELWAELDNQGVTRAWRQGARKTIHNPERPGSIEITPGPEWQGYDLEEDPFESNLLEVSADRRATVQSLYDELRLAGRREDEGVNLGTQQKALLEALGYTVDGAGN